MTLSLGLSFMAGFCENGRGEADMEERRSTGAVLQQLTAPVRVQKAKTYHCIICNKAYANKKWLTRHHHTHNIPFVNRSASVRRGVPAYREYMPAFTHPSCWSAEGTSLERLKENTARKKAGVKVPDDSAGPTEWKAYQDAEDSEQLGALTLEELMEKKEWKRCQSENTSQAYAYPRMDY